MITVGSCACLHRPSSTSEVALSTSAVPVQETSQRQRALSAPAMYPLSTGHLQCIVLSTKGNTSTCDILVLSNTLEKA